MKVVFLFGGLPHYYNLILSKLNKIPGLEVSVIIPDKRGSTLGAGVHESSDGINFEVIRLEEYKTFYGKFYFKGLASKVSEIKPDIIVASYSYGLGMYFDFTLRKIIKRESIKIAYKTIPFEEPYYSNALQHYSNVWYNKGQSFIGKKMISSVLAFIYVFFNQKMFQYFDAHINYIDEAEAIYSSYGVDTSKIFVTYNSPDTQTIDTTRALVLEMPKLYDKKEIYLLHVGRLVQWKRVDMLVDALAQLKKETPNVKLKIIGDGPELSNLKDQVKLLELENDVEFIGAVYDPLQLGQIMHSCNVYVLAGIGGLSINEAMIYGMPIICSVADGTEKKLVRNGYNGFRIQPDNLEELVVAIKTIISNADLMKIMGANSRSIIENEVNEKVVINGYLRAFNYLIPTANLKSIY